jgi:hypothetical protein
MEFSALMYHDGFLACIHGGGARREGESLALEISSPLDCFVKPVKCALMKPEHGAVMTVLAAAFFHRERNEFFSQVRALQSFRG